MPGYALLVPLVFQLLESGRLELYILFFLSTYDLTKYLYKDGMLHVILTRQTSNLRRIIPCNIGYYNGFYSTNSSFSDYWFGFATGFNDSPRGHGQDDSCDPVHDHALCRTGYDAGWQYGCHISPCGCKGDYNNCILINGQFAIYESANPFAEESNKSIFVTTNERRYLLKGSCNIFFVRYLSWSKPEGNQNIYIVYLQKCASLIMAFIPVVFSSLSTCSDVGISYLILRFSTFNNRSIIFLQIAS
jgi:hypothetical protein